MVSSATWSLPCADGAAPAFDILRHHAGDRTWRRDRPSPLAIGGVYGWLTDGLRRVMAARFALRCEVSICRRLLLRLYCLLTWPNCEL